ncbi:ABC-three component system protein [Spirosoma endbachense]|uniref:ABC-three component systems C-terminal domain-containing protein n=1 Tax=Spirosoma endbachense TaxID=2666025 RepID=A0A6P1VZV1_9BACT|nr:ABC-three component system protein [Spirosoma endbachense]QHV97300.1 hypothetical protein GJR95_20825 [Spirosoma endbachense]
MMTTDELYLVRSLFKQEIYTRHGQSYEDFFVNIMRAYNSNFESVRPQGRYGDRKNDGFDRRTGTYYQVYAPENPLSREKETIDKLCEDFAGLYNYWNSLYPVKEFFFVINDKYNGVYATVQEQYAAIENAYPGVKCASFLAHHLEDIFLKFPLSECIKWIHLLPNIDVNDFKISILDDVIKHLLKEKTLISSVGFPENPDFDRKIEFNRLGKVYGSLLTTASLHEGTLENYFRVNSAFAKEDLQAKFVMLYREGKEKFADMSDGSDQTFLHILNEAMPVQHHGVQDAVLVLMSYFFSYCDIFEEPLAPKQLGLFSA